MNERSPAEFDKAFWDIVIADRDIVISEAARDEKIVDITRWLLKRDLREMPFAPDYYEVMREILTEKYWLPEELHSRVYNECENNLKDEKIYHGQA